MTTYNKLKDSIISVTNEADLENKQEFVDAAKAFITENSSKIRNKSEKKEFIDAVEAIEFESEKEFFEQAKEILSTYVVTEKFNKFKKFTKKSDADEDEDEDDKNELKKSDDEDELKKSDEDDSDDEDDDEDKKDEIEDDLGDLNDEETLVKKNKKAEIEDNLGDLNDEETLVKKNKKNEEGDEDEDDEEMSDAKKAKDKKDEKAVLETLLKTLNVSEEDAAEVVAILKTELRRRAKLIAESIDKNLQVTYNKNLEDVKANVAITNERYLAKATDNFVEKYKVEMVDQEKMTKLEDIVEDMRSLFTKYNMSLDANISQLNEGHTVELNERNEKIDQLSDDNRDLKQKVLLMEVEEISKTSSAGMTDTDKERFGDMIAEVEFSSSEDFEKKALSIREKYFISESVVSEKIVKTNEGDVSFLVGDEKKRKVKIDLSSAIKGITG